MIHEVAEYAMYGPALLELVEHERDSRANLFIGILNHFS